MDTNTTTVGADASADKKYVLSYSILGMEKHEEMFSTANPTEMIAFIEKINRETLENSDIWTEENGTYSPSDNTDMYSPQYYMSLVTYDEEGEIIQEESPDHVFPDILSEMQLIEDYEKDATGEDLEKIQAWRNR